MTKIEQRIKRIIGALSEFIKGSFYFVPRGQPAPALIAAPITEAFPLLNRPAALPITALAQAIEVLQYCMSRTV